MTNEQLEIARAFVACGRWRWMPGMRAVGREGWPAAWFRVEEPLQKLGGIWRDAVPDITDPCTRGGILQVVREAWGCPTAYLVHSGGLWVLMRRDPMALALCRPHETEAEALLLALQAAPEVEDDKWVKDHARQKKEIEALETRLAAAEHERDQANARRSSHAKARDKWVKDHARQKGEIEELKSQLKAGGS